MTAGAGHGWLVPDDQPPGIGAVMTTRAGGVSAAPWDTLNLGSAVGDAPEAVARNRRILAEAIGARPVFLRQVHGTLVAGLGGILPADDQVDADAAVTAEPGVACTVQVADCLPVLLAAPGRRGVAAAHAGWRGLAGGVVEAAVGALCEQAGCEPRALWAWLGPCIGPRAFEVGPDVLEAFGDDADAFIPSPAVAGVPRWHADLALLAQRRLQRLGIPRAGGGRWCTVSEPSRFFSFRRDRVCGRLAAAVWIEP